MLFSEALAGAEDYEEAEISLSIALLLVRGKLSAIQRGDWKKAQAQHQASAQSSPDTIKSLEEFSVRAGNT